jgi:hypothetical protein
MMGALYHLSRRNWHELFRAWRKVCKGEWMLLSSTLIAIALASMLSAGAMARTRHRSIRAWVWATFILGPLGPLMLYVLGDGAERASRP